MWFASKQPFVGRSVAFRRILFPGPATIFGTRDPRRLYSHVKMTFGLVDVRYSLPEGQAIKLTFFAP